MSFEALILVALSLSMDAFGASISRAAGHPTASYRDGLRAAAIFGLFATAAPLLGWAIGRTVLPAIEDYDHWVAFLLLGGIGFKMIHDARRPGPGPTDEPALRIGVLLVSAVATNLDAGIVGVTLPALHVDIHEAAAIIGGMTFIVSLFGARIGRASGRALGPVAEIVGGVLLIGIGAKILIQHTVFGAGTAAGLT